MAAALPDRQALSITMLTPGFPPARGGIETHVHELVEALADRGFDVEVLTSRHGTAQPSISDGAGYRVRTYPEWRLQAMAISPRLLWTAVRRRRTGLLHVHGYHSLTAAALLVAGSPTVFTAHYHGRTGHSRLADVLHIVYYRLARVFLRNCDAIICVSDAEREILIRDFPFVRDLVTVIPNGVDVARIRAAAPPDSHPPTVLCISRLVPYKNVGAVIRAFVDVPAPAQLIVIGEGELRDDLRRLITTLGLGDRVRMLGSVSDDELIRWLRSADVYVSMSEKEAFGIAPVEAAVAGARVILSDIPAHRELVRNFLHQSAVLCAGYAPEALGAEIRRQLAHPPLAPPQIPGWVEIATRTAAVYAEATERADSARNGRSLRRMLRPRR